MTRSSVVDCSIVRPLLGVSVLGKGMPDEEQTIADHCAQCAACSATYDDLAMIVPLLATVDIEDVTAGLPEPRPELLRRIIAETRPVEPPIALMTRRKRRVVGVAAAAGLLAASVLLVVAAPWRDDVSQPIAQGPAVVASATDHTSGVHGRFVITSVETGSEVRAALSGVAPGEHCRLVAEGAEGQREVAATWAVQYDGRATITGHTSLPSQDITGLTVVTDDGQTLLRISQEELRTQG